MASGISKEEVVERVSREAKWDEEVPRFELHFAQISGTNPS